MCESGCFDGKKKKTTAMGIPITHRVLRAFSAFVGYKTARQEAYITPCGARVVREREKGSGACGGGREMESLVLRSHPLDDDDSDPAPIKLIDSHFSVPNFTPQTALVPVAWWRSY